MNFLDVLFPEKCLYCKKSGNYICENCFEKLNNKYLFEKVENEYFDYIVCGSVYQGIIKTQMHNFKFHEQAYLHKYFIELILKNNEIYKFLKNFDLITYVPMSKNKQFFRGYNQSELLAKELGKRLDIKVVDLLIKTKENRVQSSLLKNERMKNVENVFEFNNKFMCNYCSKNNCRGEHCSPKINKNIILVDDIFTTGSTLNVCSKILKENGINNICALAISKTEFVIL